MSLSDEFISKKNLRNSEDQRLSKYFSFTHTQTFQQCMNERGYTIITLELYECFLRKHFIVTLPFHLVLIFGSRNLTKATMPSVIYTRFVRILCELIIMDLWGDTFTVYIVLFSHFCSVAKFPLKCRKVKKEIFWNAFWAKPYKKVKLNFNCTVMHVSKGDKAWIIHLKFKHKLMAEQQNVNRSVFSVLSPRLNSFFF